MLRGTSTMTLWADDLPQATRWCTELLGAKQLEARDPFGNVLGIMYNRHYLDILGNRG